jgi:hypothetical protein
VGNLWAAQSLAHPLRVGGLPAWLSARLTSVGPSPKKHFRGRPRDLCSSFGLRTGAAALDRYLKNPFRVLGLPADCAEQDWRRRAKLVLQALVLGTSPQPSSWLPYLPAEPITREDVQAAARELEDPRSRLRHEIFWLANSNAAALLKRGQTDALADACIPGAGQAGPDASLARHDLAVCLHSVSIAFESGYCANPERWFCNWPGALRAWQRVIEDDGYWHYLGRRAAAIADARLGPGDVDAVRASLPADLLRANEAIVTACRSIGQRVAGGAPYCIRDQIVAVQRSPFEAVRRAACERMLEPLRAEARRVRSEIAGKLATLRSSPLRALAQSVRAGRMGGLGAGALTTVRKHLANDEAWACAVLTPRADQVNVEGVRDLDGAAEILESTVGCLREISVAYNNEGDDPRQAERVIGIAVVYATTPEVRARLEADARSLSFIIARREARAAAAANQWARCIAALRQAARCADSAAELREVNFDIGVASRRRDERIFNGSVGIGIAAFMLALVLASAAGSDWALSIALVTAFAAGSGFYRWRVQRAENESRAAAADPE